MRLSGIVRRPSTRKGPLIRIDPLIGVPKDVPIEIKSFDDPLAMRIFTANPPKRTRVKFPELPPLPAKCRLENLTANEEPTSEPYYKSTLEKHSELIQAYLNNRSKGYDPERIPTQHQPVIEFYRKWCNLRMDLHPDCYKSFMWFYESSIPIPDYFFNEDLTTIPIHSAVKHLTVRKKKTGGRDDTGCIATRHIGGGFKRRLRFVNASRNFANPTLLVRYEHDPNRTTKIALVQDTVTNELQYVLMPSGVPPGTIIDNNETIIQAGMTMRLEKIPNGTKIFNLEIHPGRGGQLVRSAGTHATIISHNAIKGIVNVQLPSGKTKEVDAMCSATIGSASNLEWIRIPIGKAGRARNLGIRPTVRGVAMNAVDHPHGGGKGGKSKGHLSQSPWGKLCK